MHHTLNVFAIGGGIAGSMLIASGNVQYIKWAYIFFLVSTIASICIQVGQEGQHGLLMLNVFFVAVNLFGLARWAGFI